MHSAFYFGRAIDHVHRRLQYGGIGDANGFDIAQRAKGPTGVVIRIGIGDVVILRVEQHIRHSAERLVHADDVAARWEFTFVGLTSDFEFLVGFMDLHALLLQQIHQFGSFNWARIIGRNHVCRRTFGGGLGH